MPRSSPDDSQPVMPQPSSRDDNPELASAPTTWHKLGLCDALVDCLLNKQNSNTPSNYTPKSETAWYCPAPTPVQAMVIPKLLASNRNSTAFFAATGSGKTLAYALPLVQWLKQQEAMQRHQNDTLILPAHRPLQRPRLLILVPTRELGHQIKQVIKALCHVMKLSSCALVGGDDYSTQKKQLTSRPVDIVVATPGRLLKHWQQKDPNVYLSHVQMIVLDEMDTLLEQGFAADLKQVLYPLLYHKQAEQAIDVTKDLQPTAPQLILTSATMTQMIAKMMGDTSADVSAKKHYTKAPITPALPSSKKASSPASPLPLILPPLQILKAPGLHKAVPRLQQVFVDVGPADKITLLVDLVLGNQGRSNKHNKKKEAALTMIFCNTAPACRAVQFALQEAGVDTLAYHGELPSTVRHDNLQVFRKASILSAAAANKKSKQSPDFDDDIDMVVSEVAAPRILVCTDLAARGLDVPQVDHVILFDFPLNALDYLHRVGRTARGQREGGRVTALVAKRDQVLAQAIERAVVQGLPLDGLSSRKSDYTNGQASAGPKTFVSASTRSNRSSASSRTTSASARTSKSSSSPRSNSTRRGAAPASSNSPSKGDARPSFVRGSTRKSSPTASSRSGTARSAGRSGRR
jgi:superfamily II DNA/RNA helicase